MIADIASQLSNQSDGLRTMALKAVSSRANPLYAGAQYSAAASGGYSEMSQHSEQYRHFTGHVYTSIRPLAVRVARQDVRVGVQVSGGPKTKKFIGELSVKACRQVFGFVTGERRKAIMDIAPPAIRQKALTDGLEALESHPIINAIENPNDLMTKWQLLYWTICNLKLTGKCFWWIEEDTDGQIRFWPIPASWVRPRWTGGNLRDGWYVQPSIGGHPYPVAGQDMLYFSYPDPSDPLTGAISPVQTQGDSLAIDRYLQRSRLSSFRQGPKPGLVVTAGRMKDQDGRDMGARPVLTPKQRTDLIDTIRYVLGGVERHGDPVIIDGLIENVEPWTTTPAEMDYQGGDDQNSRRVFRALGTNPISFGEIQGANRAQAYVADDVLCDNVINPDIVMLSEVMTKTLSVRPQFVIPGAKLYVWIDECRPHDADLKLAQLSFLASKNWLAGNEARTAYDFPSVDGLDKPPAPAPIAEPPSARTQAAGGQATDSGGARRAA